MQKITIANVESKTGTSDKGPWTKTTITGTDGLKASGFDPGLANLKPGTIIEAEIEVKGKFTNIGKFTVISQGQPPPTESKPVSPNGKPSYGSRSPEERASIEKQVALKELGEMIRAGKADHWLSTWEWTIAQMLRASPSLAHAASPVLAEDSEPEQTPKPAIPGFRDGIEFSNWWSKFGGIPWLDQQGVLNVKHPTEIKDLKAAHNTLAKIKAEREREK